MATSTYTYIDSITLGSSASSVTFSSIPQTYRDLVLVINAATTPSEGYARAYLNSDTGTNYFRVLATANGSSFSSLSDNTAFLGISNTVRIDTDITFQAICHFLDYSATDKYKTMLLRNGNVADELNMAANKWENTAAITSIELVLNANSYASGSTFALYGIEA